MKTFKLNNEPLSVQLSIRISNLIATYGSAAVQDFLNETLKENRNKKTKGFDREDLQTGTLALTTNSNLALYIQTTQMVRYFGPKLVKSYWNEVYTKKVA